MLTPCSDLLSFKIKFRNCQESLPVSLYETVTEFKNGPDNVFIVSCKTVNPDHRDEYVFSYIIPSKEIVYSVSMTCRSLENTDYKGVYSNLISHVDAKRWVSKDGGPLSHSVLWSRLNYLFKGFENEREKIKEHKKNMTPIVISREYAPVGGSHRFLVVETTETAKSRTRRKTTSLDAKIPPEKAPAKAKKLKEKAAAEEKAKVIEDESMISTLTDIPMDTVKNDAVRSPQGYTKSTGPPAQILTLPRSTRFMKSLSTN